MVPAPKVFATFGFTRFTTRQRSIEAFVAACSEAGVPDGVVFRTKPELALAMLTRALDGRDIDPEYSVRQALPDDGAREKARQALGPMFSDEAFKSRMQQLAPPLPWGKVKKGGTWSNDDSG